MCFPIKRIRKQFLVAELARYNVYMNAGMLGAVMVALGAAMTAIGLYLQTQTRTNFVDNLAWYGMLTGLWLVGSGMAVRLLARSRRYRMEGEGIFRREVTNEFPPPSTASSKIGHAAMVGGSGILFMFLVAVLLVGVFWAGLFFQGATNSKYFASLDAARATAPYVGEFKRLFPIAQIQYTFFDPGPGPGIDMRAVLHGRYELTMRLPVEWVPGGTAIAGYGEPTFNLTEAANVRGNSISWNPSNHRTFGATEWKTIVENNGDFSAIDYTMIKDQPTGLKEH